MSKKYTNIEKSITKTRKIIKVFGNEFKESSSKKLVKEGSVKTRARLKRMYLTEWTIRFLFNLKKLSFLCSEYKSIVFIQAEIEKARGIPRNPISLNNKMVKTRFNETVMIEILRGIFGLWRAKK